MGHTNITISLDTRRVKRNGTFPLVMRLGHDNRTIPISIGVSLYEKDWDDEEKKVKKSYTGVSNVTRLNNEIQKKRTDAMDIILTLDTSKMTVAQIKEKISPSEDRHSFFKYAALIVKQLNEANRTGTARSYGGIIPILSTFHKKDLAFSDLNFTFLKGFEAWHLSKGNEINSLGVYMRAIRAIYNSAIREGLADRTSYPFADYKIKSKQTKKRAVDKEFLQRIISLELTENHPCFHARNYFVASYMMYGMNFVDMAYLRRDNIINGRIQYRRRKTSKYYDIKITPQLEKVLAFYKGNPVFPILSTYEGIDPEKDIVWARKRYNTKLKKIALLCGIEENLTSYVGRHSFATQAMLNQTPLNAISAMLGHSSLKTTEVYLKSLPSDVLDHYNASVLSVL